MIRWPTAGSRIVQDRDGRLALLIAISLAIHVMALGLLEVAAGSALLPPELAAQQANHLVVALIQRGSVEQPATDDHPASGRRPRPETLRPGDPPALAWPVNPRRMPHVNRIPELHALAPVEEVGLAPEGDRRTLPASGGDAGSIAASDGPTRSVNHGSAPERTAAPLSGRRVAYLEHPMPVYPEGARRQGQQGLTLLHVLVSKRGLPLEVSIAGSSGIAELDAAAVAGVARWTFVPATREDEAIDSRIQIPIRFRLTDP